MVGRPDDLTGEAVCAFVVLKRARPTGDEALKIAKGEAITQDISTLENPAILDQLKHSA